MIENIFAWFESRPRLAGATRIATGLISMLLQAVFTAAVFIAAGGLLGLAFGSFVAAAANQPEDIAYKITVIPVFLGGLLGFLVGAMVGGQGAVRRLESKEKYPRPRATRARDVVAQAIVAEELGCNVTRLEVNHFGRSQLSYLAHGTPGLSRGARVYRELTVLVAAPGAENFFGRDREVYRQRISETLDELALVNAETGVVEKVGRDQLLAEAVTKAREIVRAHDDGIESIEKELLVAGVLSGSRFRALLALTEAHTSTDRLAGASG